MLSAASGPSLLCLHSRVQTLSPNRALTSEYFSQSFLSGSLFAIYVQNREWAREWGYTHTHTKAACSSTCSLAARTQSSAKGLCAVPNGAREIRFAALKSHKWQKKRGRLSPPRCDRNNCRARAKCGTKKRPGWAAVGVRLHSRPLVESSQPNTPCHIIYSVADRNLRCLIVPPAFCVVFQEWWEEVKVSGGIFHTHIVNYIDTLLWKKTA